MMYYKQINSRFGSVDEPVSIPDQEELLCSCNEETSRTIVFHPNDPSTDFLSAIYKGKGWDVITNPFLENDEVAELIRTHSRIISLGHGSENGLFGGYGMIINATLAPLLKKRETVNIWCNADKFVKEHKLKGFYTGMFISETIECAVYDIKYADELTIELSNDLFALTLGKHMDSKNILKNVKREYHVDDNPIVTFNRNRLYSNIGCR